MKQILVTTQAQLDAISEIKIDEIVTINSTESLRLNLELNIFGKIIIKTKLDTSWSRKFVAWGSSTPHIVAWGSSTPHIEA